MSRVRLPRYLAQAGVASRRKSEDLIVAGLVTVNGRVVTEPATKVEPEADEVAVRGEVVRPRFAESSPEASRALALNKPRDTITARSDPGGGATVYDLVPEPEGGRLIYVGRLDRDTEGLLLFTTHGELAHRLTHPRWEVERAYRVEVAGALDERRLRRAAREGIELEDGRTAPFRAKVIDRRTLELVLTEGKKREVRRIVAACGGRVERLTRIRYDRVTLRGIEEPGRWRWLQRDEVERLLARVDLPPA